LKRWIPALFLTVSGIYYYLLSAKIFTWVYMSIDAGDWLSLLHWWYVPHRFGKPLIILLARFVGLFPGDDILKLTLAMAIIPAAITVMFTYLIALKLTGQVKLAVVAALVLMGAVVFTSQSGVVEQYTFTAMFVTIAFWFHLRGNKVGTLAFLGLATATHIAGAFFFLVWICGHWKEKMEWLKASWAYVVTGILPYGLLFMLMANPDVPKLHAGGLSWQALFGYFFAGDAAAAMLAVSAAPGRLLEMLQVTLITLGVAIVPFIVGIRSLGRNEKIVIGVIGFTSWFWLTALYPSVWKYACFFLPLMAAYVAVGLSRMAKWHTVAVAIGAVALIGLNGVYFNTDEIARQDPRATRYYEAVMDLPDGSAIVTSRGGAYGFTVHYVLSQGKEIVPIPLYNPFDTSTNKRRESDQRYRDCVAWIERIYGVKGNDMFEHIAYAQAQGRDVYFGSPVTWTWSKMVETECPATWPSRIVSVNTEPDFRKDDDWRYDDDT